MTTHRRHRALLGRSHLGAGLLACLVTLGACKDPDAGLRGTWFFDVESNDTRKTEDQRLAELAQPEQVRARNRLRRAGYRLAISKGRFEFLVDGKKYVYRAEFLGRKDGYRYRVTGPAGKRGELTCLLGERGAVLTCDFKGIATPLPTSAWLKRPSPLIAKAKNARWQPMELRLALFAFRDEPAPAPAPVPGMGNPPAGMGNPPAGMGEPPAVAAPPKPVAAPPKPAAEAKRKPLPPHRVGLMVVREDRWARPSRWRVQVIWSAAAELDGRSQDGKVSFVIGPPGRGELVGTTPSPREIITSRGSVPRGVVGKPRAVTLYFFEPGAAPAPWKISPPTGRYERAEKLWAPTRSIDKQAGFALRVDIDGGQSYLVGYVVLRDWLWLGPRRVVPTASLTPAKLRAFGAELLRPKKQAKRKPKPQAKAR